MNKIGRNDPCACGSGKKYKKCHGGSNVVEISPARYNSELDRLHLGLVDFTINENENEMAKINQKYQQPSLLEDEDGRNLYMSGLSAWAILNEPILNDQTIFDIYYKRQQSKIKHGLVRETFESWSEAIPAIYKILSVTEEKVFLQDVRTKDEYNIAVREDSDFEVGNMLIGILLPFVEQHEFLFSVFELFDQKIIDMVEGLSVEELTNDYPNVLAKALTMETVSTDQQWDNPEYEMVADIFAKHMHEKEADESIVTTGLQLWKEFTEMESPTFRKPEAYAAALEYVLQTTVLERAFQSQKDIAEEYGTSATTISKNAIKIKKVLTKQLEKVVAELMHAEADEKAIV